MNDKIPVIINNRNLLTWTKAMVEKIKQFDNVGDIIIVDNDSTYEPLIQWYKTNPCEIIYTQRNLGHIGAWSSGIVDKLNADYYVVSDPDLGLDDIPNDALDYLKDNLIHYNLKKIGFGLDWKSVKFDSPYYAHLMGHEKNRWTNSKMENDIYFDVEIDTTFALYSKKYYFIGGASTGSPYVAKHFPWYMSVDERNNNEEFSFYLKRANSSCSYKTFLKI
jgi:GT2 family glycosyltransferase